MLKLLEYFDEFPRASYFLTQFIATIYCLLSLNKSNTLNKKKKAPHISMLKSIKIFNEFPSTKTYFLNQ